MEEERRKDRIDFQTYMEVLVSNVKETVKIELTSVKQEIKNLEEKVITRIDLHEKESGNKITNIEEELDCLKTKVSSIENRVEALELKPIKDNSETIEKFKSTFKKILYTTLAGGIITFILYLIKMFLGV